MNNPTLQAPSIDMVVLKGGLDQVTPTLTLAPGALRQCTNFEAAVTGGYNRIKGYERFDGNSGPTAMSESESPVRLSVSAIDNAAEINDAISSSGGASGVVSYISGLTIVIVKVVGTFAVGETLTVGVATIGVIDNVAVTPVSPQQDAMIRKSIADVYRADIAAVPGSGSVLGVVEYNDTVYAFRNNAGGTACDIYKSSASGWVNVQLYKTVSFTSGGTATPADGATLTQGSYTAVIKRVVKTTGVWSSGSAAGQFIIETPTGNFSAGAATIGAVNVTLSGIQTALTLSPGGRFAFEEHNFFGQAVTKRIYGCDGVNKAFEFDGDVLVPLTTGTSPDTPTHLCCHKGYLFLMIGSSAFHSAPGDAYNWSGAGGAGEIAVGDVITDCIAMPGGTTSGTLGIFSRSNTYILYGSSPTDWNLVTYNTGTGAAPFSVQNMAQTFAFDDRGVNSIQAALQYGNFAQTAISNAVLPFITERINLLTASTLCRRKSQYRVFFSDGFALFVTVVNNKLMGCAPAWFPDAVTCCYEGKDSTGADVIYFGSTNGMIYQMEKGTSFDGAKIDFSLTTNFSNARSPRTLKRYRKMVPEIFADNGSYVEFEVNFLIGYSSVEYSQPDISTYNQFAGQSKWDTFTWDNYNWDEELSTPMECDCDGTAENIAVQISGSLDYIPEFTLNSFLIHYNARRMMR